MPEQNKWTAEDIPDLSGKTIVVTGANSGLGYEASLQFAGKGARVILACRNPGKADTALQGIRAAYPQASVEAMGLDLANLASIRAFADAFLAKHDSLHVLCNNAGVMALPLCRTADGFEMQFGTNHLGHFALTGLLLERLLTTPGARIVTQSSTFHRMGKMRFDDLNWERGYRKWPAYGQSKLSNLLFAYELQRKLEGKKAALLSVACHPGYAATNLQLAGPKAVESSLQERAWDVLNRIFAQSAAMGALPMLYAATAGNVRGGDYIGPDGLGESWGHPKKVSSNARSRDRAAAATLWKISEQLTGVSYDALN